MCFSWRGGGVSAPSTPTNAARRPRFCLMTDPDAPTSPPTSPPSTRPSRARPRQEPARAGGWCRVRAGVRAAGSPAHDSGVRRVRLAPLPRLRLPPRAEATRKCARAGAEDNSFPDAEWPSVTRAEASRSLRCCAHAIYCFSEKTMVHLQVSVGFQRRRIALRSLYHALADFGNVAGMQTVPIFYTEVGT